jgi:hypothetical protein
MDQGLQLIARREGRFAVQMFQTLTFQGAAGFLGMYPQIHTFLWDTERLLTGTTGGFGFLLTAVPWVLLKYGTRIRARSKLAREIMVT